jgi:hypothetical protein
MPNSRFSHSTTKNICVFEGGNGRTTSNVTITYRTGAAIVV